MSWSESRLWYAMRCNAVRCGAVGEREEGDDSREWDGYQRVGVEKGACLPTYLPTCLPACVFVCLTWVCECAGARGARLWWS